MLEAAEHIERTAAAASAPRPGTGALPLMLLIDDDPMVGRFLSHAIEECGYRALATINAESFRREYRLLRPDILAVDLGIPGSDGIEMLRFLAQEKCEAPIVIISGFDRRVLESAMRLGEALGLHMIGPLTKPVRFHELEELLGTVSGAER